MQYIMPGGRNASEDDDPRCSIDGDTKHGRGAWARSAVG